jgi:hypothetical protein
MIHLVSAILAGLGFASALTGSTLACAVFGVLALAWCAVFETPFGR